MTVKPMRSSNVGKTITHKGVFAGYSSHFGLQGKGLHTTDRFPGLLSSLNLFPLFKKSSTQAK